MVDKFNSAAVMANFMKVQWQDINIYNFMDDKTYLTETYINKNTHLGK